MAQFEPRDMTGVLFINDRKEKENHPDRTGYVLIDGKKWMLSGWIKSGARGQFLSLAVKAPMGAEDVRREANQEPARPKPSDPLDGEFIPF